VGGGGGGQIWDPVLNHLPCKCCGVCHGVLECVRRSRQTAVGFSSSYQDFIHNGLDNWNVEKKRWKRDSPHQCDTSVVTASSHGMVTQPTDHQISIQKKRTIQESIQTISPEANWLQKLHQRIQNNHLLQIFSKDCTKLWKVKGDAMLSTNQFTKLQNWPIEKIQS
jgi:hypothetical protein